MTTPELLKSTVDGHYFLHHMLCDYEVHGEYTVWLEQVRCLGTGLAIAAAAPS
jgi:hypothetical protein